LLYDLHCHTTASDGKLSPLDLCARALANGVTHLAITDHDTLSGWQSLAAAPEGLALISGIEYSCVWSGMTIHIVGLGFDAEHASMQAGVSQQADAREKRALIIDERLAKLGFKGGLVAAQTYANGNQIGRPHFAKFLVDNGHVNSMNQAFDKYLGAGKPGDVKALWPELEQVVRWITEAGGIAVIAHPARYKMTNMKLRRLIQAFKEAGGGAMEVVSGSQSRDVTAYMAQLCEEYDLLASQGSDFHGPGSPWQELGRFDVMPKRCRPVSDWLARSS
jgi:predicted metal-dependent phosphoesterase TrpH